MRFPGFVVTNHENGEVCIRKEIFDDTELTPESKWMEGYTNGDPESGVWAGRDVEAALCEVRKRLLR